MGSLHSRRCLKVFACSLVVAAWTLPSQAQYDQPPPKLWHPTAQDADEAGYISFISAGADELTAKSAGLPQRPVVFSANLFLAHGVGIKATSIEDMLAYIDALKSAGAQRIEFNPGVTSIDDPGVMAKYDAVVKHIRELGLKVQINVIYARVGKRDSDGGLWTSGTREFGDFAKQALKTCAEFAARYHPDYLTAVHEPVTMDARMGVKETQPWAAYVEATVKAVKNVSPNTRVGAGGWSRDLPYFKEFAAIQDLDFLVIDIYDPAGFDTDYQMVDIAHAAHKPLFVEETWRRAFTGPLPSNFMAAAVETLTVKGIGSADFEDLDVKWMNAIALYASTHGIASITPYYTQTYFAYVTSGPDRPADPEYSRIALDAAKQGRHTRTFDAYRALAQKLTNLGAAPHINP